MKGSALVVPHLTIAGKLRRLSIEHAIGRGQAGTAEHGRK